jgi:hypothetical protein
LLEDAQTLLPLWLPEGKWQNGEWVAINPMRLDDHIGSLSVNSVKGVWKDFATGEKGGGDLISLFARLNKLEQGEACRILANQYGRYAAVSYTPVHVNNAKDMARKYPKFIMPVPKDAPTLITQAGEERRWHYLDQDGNLLLIRIRTSDNTLRKIVRTWTWCESGPGNTRWRPLAPLKPWPIYGLDRLALYPESPVIVVEGEKPADAAERLFPGWVAVTSGSADSARSADWSALAGRDVVLWPDADEAGIRHLIQVATILHPIATSLKMVELPSSIRHWIKPGKKSQGGWDLADPVPEGTNIHVLLRTARLINAEFLKTWGRDGLA